LDREKFECQFEASKTVASTRMVGATAEVKRAESEPSACNQEDGRDSEGRRLNALDHGGVSGERRVTVGSPG